MAEGAAMLSVAAVVAAALLWLGLLFGTGLYAERHPGAFAKHWRYAVSYTHLDVYKRQDFVCTGQRPEDDP